MKGSNSTNTNKRKPKIVRELDLKGMSSTAVIYTINSNKGPKQTLKINGTYYTFLLDIGASVNILGKKLHTVRSGNLYWKQRIK